MPPFTKQEERELLDWWISHHGRLKVLAAEALGVSLRTFYRWEQNGCPPWTARVLDQIRHGPGLMTPLWRGALERQRWKGFVRQLELPLLCSDSFRGERK